MAKRIERVYISRLLWGFSSASSLGMHVAELEHDLDVEAKVYNRRVFWETEEVQTETITEEERSISAGTQTYERKRLSVSVMQEFEVVE